MNTETAGNDLETLEKSINELGKSINEFEATLQNQETVETDNDLTDETTDEMQLFDDKAFKLDASLVRVRMKECDLTLTDLQGKIGVAYRTLIRWLNRDDFPQHRNLVKLADVLELEPYQLVIRWTNFTTPWPNESSDAIRYIQRRIETIVTQILEDKEISKETKLNALVKYHNILLKQQKQSRYDPKS